MTYKILSNLKYNGRTHIAGEEVEMDESIANALVEDGVLEKIRQVRPEPKPELKPEPEVKPEPEPKPEPKVREESNKK